MKQLVLALALASLVTACGGNKGKPTNPTNTGSGSATPDNKMQGDKTPDKKPDGGTDPDPCAVPPPN